MKVASPCPICQAPVVQSFLQLRSIPVNCSALWPTKTQAHQAPRGDIDLGVCRSCGMVFNVSFDPQLLTYDTSYENSLDFSPAFQEFARDLASRLINTYGIRRKHVIEIGCGNGDFLKMLCQTGDNQGFGLDPSYDGASMAQAGDQVTFVRDLYSEAYIDRPADLICCRHVLEHLPNPRELLVSLRRMLRNRLGTVVYFEVPNAESVLGGATMWDVNYPHCLYFSWPALARLFREAGFFVVRLEPCFGHQFLYAEAIPGETAAHPDQDTAAIERVVPLASPFDQQFKATVSYWSALIRDGSAKIPAQMPILL